MNMKHRYLSLGVAIAWFATNCAPNWANANDKQQSSETIRFLRVSGSGFAQESKFRLVRTLESLVVTSTTQRGEQSLTVSSRFDSKNRLTSATVTLRRGQKTQTASVRVREATAQVLRDGQEAVELSCPDGVIVTSAPDWTDAMLSVQRYDLDGAATQEFSALWIHPTRAPLQLRLKLSRLGHDTVSLGKKRVRLDRFLLVLRGGSRYVAWRNPQGRLVRLAPAGSGSGGIVLSGWELATRDLKMRPSTECDQ